MGKNTCLLFFAWYMKYCEKNEFRDSSIYPIVSYLRLRGKLSIYRTARCFNILLCLATVKFLHYKEIYKTKRSKAQMAQKKWICLVTKEKDIDQKFDYVLSEGSNNEKRLSRSKSFCHYLDRLFNYNFR